MDGTTGRRLAGLVLSVAAVIAVSWMASTGQGRFAGVLVALLVVVTIGLAMAGGPAVRDDPFGPGGVCGARIEDDGF